MKALLALLPPWVAPVAIGVLLLGLVGAYFGWQHHQREIGRLEIVAKDAKALADQKEKDVKLSAELVDGLRKQIAAREATAQPVREVIKYVTPSTCPADPALDAAAGWVRDALSQTGRPPAGRPAAPAAGKAAAPAR